jgi:hypothetical protein
LLDIENSLSPAGCLQTLSFSPTIETSNLSTAYGKAAVTHGR